MSVILFVCTGNTCRSVMGEMLLRHALPPGSKWVVKSAGTTTPGGLFPCVHVQTVLGEAGVPFDPKKRSTLLTPALIREAALILPLTRSHAGAVVDMGDSDTGSRIRLLSSFALKPREPDIDDPFGGNPSAYRASRDEIRACIPGVIEFLKKIQ